MRKAMSAQLAFFVSATSGIDASDLFRTCFQSDPDQSQQNRTISPAQPLLSRAASVLNGKSFEVQVQPGRLDVIVTPEQATEIVMGEGLRLFETEPVLAILGAAAERLAPVLTQVHRVALVVTLCVPTATYLEAASSIKVWTGLSFEDESVTDLVFQANFPRPRDDGHVVNRLIRGSVLQVQSFSLPVGPNGQAFPVAATTVGENIMLDINIVPVPVPLTAAEIVDLVSSFTTLSIHVGSAANPLTAMVEQ